MGRIKPAYHYQRQLTVAQAREDYFANKTEGAPEGAIDQRGATVELLYPSMMLKDGTAPMLFKVNVDADVVGDGKMLTVAEAGLVAVLPADTIAHRVRGSGLKPTRLHFYKGALTPTRVRTAWGSTWSKYYDDKQYSTPFAHAVGLYSARDVMDNFDALFGTEGSKREALLGTKNGRAWIDFEEYSISALT